MKTIKRFICMLTIFTMGICCYGCNAEVNDFSEEEHQKRVTERIEKRLSNWSDSNGNSYTEYKLSPLYNKNDKLAYFLLECGQYDFCFIQIIDEAEGFSCGGSKSMYRLSTMYGIDGWSYYTIDENVNPIYAIDAEGNKIVYRNSPYLIHGDNTEKKYLLTTAVGYICAIKKDDRFINAIDGNWIDITEDELKNSPAITIQFIAHKKFDL